MNTISIYLFTFLSLYSSSLSLALQDDESFDIESDHNLNFSAFQLNLIAERIDNCSYTLGFHTDKVRG